MTLKEKVLELTKVAMKAKAEGKNELTFLRSVSAEVKNMEIAAKKDSTDEDYITATSKLKAQTKDSLDMYSKALAEVPEEDTARIAELQAQVDKHAEWLTVADKILPKQLEESEVIEMIEAIIKEKGCTGPQDMKIVMPLIMAQTKGRFNGKLVNQLVANSLKSL